MSQSLENLLEKALRENNLVLSAESKQKLTHYLTLIQTWNRVFNLTTITEPRKMVYLHIIDSLIIAPYLQGNYLLDVGSGAGLPGIPLAIIDPERQWVLLDKNSKKTRFMTQAVAELQLKNVQVMHARSEDFQSSQCFDSILSRAYSTLSQFAETTEHLLCPQGVLLAMKGKHPEEECRDIPRRFLVKNITRLSINGMDVERHIVCINMARGVSE